MKYNLINHKNSLFLLFVYFFAVIIGLLIFQDYGVHIEEKYHRLNGHYWLNYISKIFNLTELQIITSDKISNIYDFTLSPVTYYNKWGAVFDVPVALLEILLKLDNVNEVYYLKHFISYIVFLIGSFFFFKILDKRYKNFNLSLLGLILYLTTPRIFGDSFLYKDILFLSFFSITVFFFLESVKKINYYNLIFFSFFSAISFNLKIFTILFPFLFLLILIIQNFYKKKIFYFIKKFTFYVLLFFLFTYILWPYLWENPLGNFFDLFSSVKNDLINVRILFFNEYIQNKLLPSYYLISWIFVSSSILQNFLFILGFLYCSSRIIKRLLNIKEKINYNDLWRSKKERTDFIIFLIFISYFTFFIVFNAPFYNGWRLAYFLNFFIIYFAINFIYSSLIFLKRKKLFTSSIYINLIFGVLVAINLYSLLSYHPFQSIYFNNFLSKKTINGFEGDYYGLSSKHFFEKILEIDKREKIKIAVACHTPLQRGLEAFPVNIQDRFQIIGQDYANADYVYKNNISEVNIKLNNKYEIPKNFSKIYEFNIKKLLIYQIYKAKF
jgi:hypothetical protein